MEKTPSSVRRKTEKMEPIKRKSNGMLFFSIVYLILSFGKINFVGRERGYGSF
jgi:hypothetical protein